MVLSTGISAGCAQKPAGDCDQQQQQQQQLAATAAGSNGNSSTQQQRLTCAGLSLHASVVDAVCVDVGAGPQQPLQQALAQRAGRVELL